MWNDLSPERKFFVQPYKTSSISDNEDVSQDNEQSLFWVHQKLWQQEVLLWYGNTVSLIDTTYMTTKFTLPLFFICMKTNTCYCVVAEFIIQGEQAVNTCNYINTETISTDYLLEK